MQMLHMDHTDERNVIKKNLQPPIRRGGPFAQCKRRPCRAFKFEPSLTLLYSIIHK